MIAATVVGNLGGDAEIKNTPNGNVVVNFSIASSQKRGGKETTTWVRCGWFGDSASKVKPYLTKGKTVAVLGTLTAREYESKGEKRTSLDLDVREMKLLGGGSDEKRAAASPVQDEESLPF